MSKKAASKQVKVTQIKSQIGHKKRHRQTLRGLGLGRIGKTSTLEDTPAVRGMIDQVSYMLKVEAL